MSFPELNQLTVNNLDQIISAFNRLQNQISIFIDAVNRKPQLDSIVLSNISLIAGNNQIPHTLGKVLTGWTIIDIVGKAKVDRYAASNNTTLFLNSDVACTISLQVF